VNLKLRFSLTISLIIIFTMAAVALFLVTYRSREIQQDLISKDGIISEKIVPGLMEDLGNYYTYQFTDFAAKVQTTTKTYPDLLHFSIINTGGEILFDTSEVTSGKYAAPDTRIITNPDILKLITSGSSRQDFSVLNHQKTIRIFTPYVDNYGSYRAMLVFDYSLSQIDTSVTQLILSLLIIFIAAVLVSTGLTAIFVSHILSPITDLTKAVREISSGKLDRQVQVKSRDEIGQLAEVFNHMVTELHAYYSNLEGKVTERTQELDTAKKAVEEKLQEVQQLNQYMTGRELKMIELKNQIADLQTQLSALKTQ
jgi:methyl-accepting chemotaxis protein